MAIKNASSEFFTQCCDLEGRVRAKRYNVNHTCHWASKKVVVAAAAVAAVAVVAVVVVIVVVILTIDSIKTQNGHALYTTSSCLSMFAALDSKHARTQDFE
eukprot:1803080-Amphidinium_carterae.1